MREIKINPSIIISIMKADLLLISQPAMISGVSVNSNRYR